MASVASCAVLHLRTYQATTLPLYAAMVAELCESPELPFELATVLEDIGQSFMRLSAHVNQTLVRRGVLDQEADVEQTVEARIDGIVRDLRSAAESGEFEACRKASALFEDESLQKALRIALLMTHELPLAPTGR